jgi:peptidyl-prolyl cis-trans isomerase A (cyclophilin A)
MGIEIRFVRALAAALLFTVVVKPDSAFAAPPVVVELETTEGLIEVEVFPDRAPRSAGDFLRYVDGRLYDGARFWRAVRLDNDRVEPHIEIIQLGLPDDSPIFPGIEHESTATTGLTHEDGTLSLGRAGVGTATASALFICVGRQPALDSGGMRNPDGLGFPAFGRVIRGMEVVRRIHASPVTPIGNGDDRPSQQIVSPVAITRAYRATSEASTPSTLPQP